ncbi:hypothetical protein AAG906_039787 [Vitis piasezkii]
MSATWHYGRLGGPHCHCRAYRASYGLPCSVHNMTMTSIISRGGHALEDFDNDVCRTGIVDIIRMATDVMCIIREDYCIPHVEHGGDLPSVQHPTSSNLPSVQPPISLDPPSVQPPISLDLPLVQAPISSNPPSAQPPTSLDPPSIQPPISLDLLHYNLLPLQTHHQHNPLPL